MRSPTPRLIAALLPIMGLGFGSPAGAQESPKMAPGFDPARAILNEKPMFDAWRVTAMEPLGEALRQGKVRNDAPVLVLRRGGKSLALLTMQMSYHHVAQGEMAGEPWMVSF